MLGIDGSLARKKLPEWVSGALIAAVFLWLRREEQRRPLRPRTQPKARRLAQNLTFAALGAGTLAVAARPVIDPLSRFVERKRWGLARLPALVSVPAAVALLDYTLYLWHVLTHRVPFLWRFHLVHHADLDLDASTALRFHFGELAISVAFRAAQVAVLGVAPLPLSIWQTLLLLSILFHHSNLRIDPSLESQLARLVVTPRLHGIHHTASLDDTDSNWSSGLTLWDRLHGTLRTRESGLPIGLPAWREYLPLRRALLLPFTRQRASFGPPPSARLGSSGRNDAQ